MLWRHGRTAWNDERRFQGQIDIPLDETGERQARRGARLLAGIPPSVLVSSDLARATATAAQLGDLTGLAVTADPALRETFAGQWQGMLAAEIEQVDGARFRAWQSGAEVRPGGGETRTEVAQRALTSVLVHLAGVPAGGVLVVCTHGGTARALIGRLLGLPVDNWHALGGLANCSWSVLEEHTWLWRLAEHNAGRLPEPVAGTDDS